MTFRLISLAFLKKLFILNLLYGQNISQQRDQVIYPWLKQNAFTIRYVEAGNGFTDLQPFRKILENVTVVGLGEATHGTREFFQFKHRLFEFLVKEMGFNSFALEASAVSCEAINEYTLYGKGTGETVLTGQGYSLWDTEEFLSLIRWMRNYNQTVPEEKKVRFYGLDVAYNEPGRKSVKAYLDKYAPVLAAHADSIFTLLSAADEKWPMQNGDFKDEAMPLLPQLQNLIQQIASGKTKLIAASSSSEFEQILRYTKLMEQHLMVITTYQLRTRFMAENLLYIMGKNPKSKFILSAHNRHVNVIDHIGDTNLGHDLREKLGSKYYAVFFETNHGSYQSRTWIPERRTLSNFIEVPLPVAPARSLPWYLSQVKKRYLFLDLRRSVNDDAVENWLNKPQLVNDIQWVYQEDTVRRYLQVNVKSYYDGILFLEKTTRARPTKNALEKASREVGF